MPRVSDDSLRTRTPRIGGAVSDCYRDDGTGTEDWGVTRITDQMKAWPGLGCGPDPLADFGRECQHGHLRRKCEVCEVLAERIAIEARLRTTADALRDALDDFVRVPYGASQEDVAYIRDFEQRARAILARLEQEGLA